MERIDPLTTHAHAHTYTSITHVPSTSPALMQHRSYVPALTETHTCMHVSMFNAYIRIRVRAQRFTCHHNRHVLIRRYVTMCIRRCMYAYKETYTCTFKVYGHAHVPFTHTWENVFTHASLQTCMYTYIERDPLTHARVH